ncbi:putative transcription factor bHLH041 [Brachypodium distachyon]|uniref:putative transcription factor bHLH041 n=1 Tax=Brachypodium distachyon TaxID=15368 RepID=UPI000234E844|nr:putative transcription factor bHLH041 [Brachypodium distachyon]|eukprot:XP_003560643.1 putative transcription factor bHLH041 [Brachypodium distachyon]
MDAIFALAAAPRARVLERAAARVPGCLYLCLWVPVTGQCPSSHLFCLDAWIGGGAGGDRARAMFEAYRGALCAVISGCVPGWAYKEGRASMELPEPNLTAAASLQVQHQFYHEAGTKMAVFMGCDSGEIEIGLSSTMVAATAAVADHVLQSLLEELLQPPPPTQPSSSSSSMPSLSVGSPEYSSLTIRSMATPPPAVVASSAGEPSTQAPPPGGLPTQYEFPSDAAMAPQAMLAAIASTSTPPPRSSLPERRPMAFKAYAAALSPRAPRAPRRPGAGQRMIKTCIALLASAHAATRARELAAAHGKEGAAQQQQPPAPTTTASQLHHMISERRRRERLNDSFQCLRALLPPGSKKDKANVLASTTEYMNTLVSQVACLREKNLQLEAQLAGLNPCPPTSGDDGGGPSEKIEVDVATTGASTSTPSQQQPREVSVKITVRAECDMPEVLISLLTWLKETGSATVVSVEARQHSGVALAQASLTLRIPEAGDIVDLTRLKEALTKVLEDAVTPPPRRQPESP